MDIYTLSWETAMQAEIAWQKCLDYLRQEMSRAAFDTWVKDVLLLHFEDGVFTLGTASAYGRDWLEARLASTLQRYLTGLMAVPVEVVFVVNGPAPTPPEEEAPEAEDDPLVIEPIRESLKTAIIQPERIVAVPRYLLRWIPYLGADLFWLVVAFRQARFLNTPFGEREKPFTAQASQIYPWCGMSRATFWRMLDRPELSWFVERLPSVGWSVDAASGRAKQSANRYRITADLPLTPADAQALRTYLLETGIREDAERTLKTALEAAPTQILAYPPPQPTIQDWMAGKPEPVNEVVRTLIAPEDMTADVVTLCEQLADKILRPADHLPVSWYFLQEWLPRLEAAPALLVVLLRSYGYYNPLTGELRDEVWIEGGYGELAHLLGLQRAKTVLSWFPAATGRGPRNSGDAPSTRREQDRLAKTRAGLQQFIERVELRSNEHGQHAWKVRVKLDADPLTPEDLQAVTWGCELIQNLQRAGVLSVFMSWLDQEETQDWIESGLRNSSIETLKTWEIPALRLDSAGNSIFETLKQCLNSSFETLKGAGIPSLRRFKVLQILNTLREVQENPTPNADPSNKPVGAAWNLEKLLEVNRVSAKKKAALLAREHSANEFVSWLLYAASAQGGSIQDPLGLAISKLLENPGQGAGGLYERLAQLPAGALIDLLLDELGFRRPSQRDWRQFAEGVPHMRLERLLDEFGIETKET